MKYTIGYRVVVEGLVEVEADSLGEAQFKSKEELRKAIDLTLSGRQTVDVFSQVGDVQITLTDNPRS